ncbi:MAG TPA: phage holin family protein [Armatimonadota bacterium]|jgi:putative membrane protein
MGFITRLVMNALALWLTVLLGQKMGIEGLGFKAGAQPANAIFATVVMVLVLTVVNATIGLLLKFLTTPLNCLTLGLFSFVINALMFMLAAAVVNQLGYGFRVDTFGAGLFGSVVMGIISAVATALVHDADKGKKDED